MQPDEASPRILVVDDEPAIRKALHRILTSRGYTVSTAEDVPGAQLELAGEATFDVVLTDLGLPGGSGLDVLAAAHRRDASLPVIFLTGAGDLDAAHQAIERGALRYLVKPVITLTLLSAIEEACRARAATSGARPIARTRVADRDLQRVVMARHFDSALDKLWIALQPVASIGQGRVTAYEALVRSDEPAMKNPAILLEAAEELGRLPDIGRRIRQIVAGHIDQTPAGVDLLVNLHPSDLADDDLFDPEAPLSRIAGRVILEITERASLDAIPDVHARIGTLRALGFRIAIDDLGAGYGSLSAMALIGPDLVKLDMSLIRNINNDPLRTRMVASIGAMCDQLGIPWLCEGVETVEELRALLAIGADLVQGYFLGRPVRGFSSVAAELFAAVAPPAPPRAALESALQPGEPHARPLARLVVVRRPAPRRRMWRQAARPARAHRAGAAARRRPTRRW